ncbi:uncharacterized protein P174DRAFT_457612 [Aspergillus novofumigatus IBT 16806]|uniref:Ribonucleases P/MRP subunit Pop8-like domain-containing protein n=1 Tax=Aspergillus novofumigatus (strain IBT 16806) TaxID=1392255 RepID=A0A2I1CGW4_ASPN1|nr:uncharacterized protein P174DRAFT_457612 [Aspergillus novofumigatus IBT 16806]PKX96863.1 hypothetical protein P174DRAFT_457612 [Aspergillus novofumigatus IBT 16806]
MTSTIDKPQNLESRPTPSKRKSPEGTDASKISSKVLTFTSRNPPWTYLKLQLYALLYTHHSTHPPTHTLANPPRPLTAKTHLTAALAQFLGLTGTAIPLDILKIAREDEAQTPTVWIRVPLSDAAAVVAALSSWIGGGGGSKSATATATGGAWRGGCVRRGITSGGGTWVWGDLFVP